MKVSVLITTYNHEKYISQCIEGALMQKVNFDFEILIGDDASTDNTPEICKKYHLQYPDKIRIFLNEPKDKFYINGKPLGRKNFINILSKARGEYIARCDGDDYWTDPHKLQTQVDILEKHPECVACHHWQKMAVMNENGEFKEKESPKDAHGYYSKEITTAADLFAFKLKPQTRTLIFRNIFNTIEIPSWFLKVRFGDLPLALILSRYGNFYFIDKEMAVYRITDQGVSSVFHSRKGYVEGNKGWLEAWTYALRFHNYNHIDEAIIGMKLFINRIKNFTKDSIIQRVDLLYFVLFVLKLKGGVKWKLLKEIVKMN